MIDSSYWTLEHVEGVLTKTFEEWFIDTINLDLKSLNSDIMAFDALVDFDSDPAFAVGDSVIIRQGGVGVFYGRVVRNDRIGQAEKEFIHYELEGPWWYLENRAFETPWKVSTGAQEERGRVLVFQSTSGARFDIASQLSEVIAFVIVRGAPFVVGSISVGTSPPFEEVEDQTCAELIRHILRWTPDVTSWFDYSVVPPALHIRSRASSPVIERTIGQEGFKVLECTPRHDLKIPGVKAIFEQTDSITIDGVTTTKRKTIRQLAPSPSGVDTWGTLVFTVALSGSSVSFQTQTIKRKEFDLRQLDFWKEKHPELVGAIGPDGTGSPVIEVSETSAIQDPRPPLSLFGYDGAELVGGAIPAWLESQVYSTTCKALISYQFTDVNGGIIVQRQRPFAVQIKATALNGVYSQLVSETAGEAIPDGLAQDIFNSTNTLQWQGHVVFESAEVSGLIHPGHLLNVLGGRAEWGTMAAQVQQVTQSIGTGTTNVMFGPPRHLGPQDFLTLQRMNRKRSETIKLQERIDSIVRVQGASVGPAGAANTSATAAFTAPSKMEMAERQEINQSKIILNVTDIPAEVRTLLGDLKHLKLREVRCCNEEDPEDEFEWWMTLLGSAPYRKV